MNTEVFGIHDMSTFYKIGDLKYNGINFMLVGGKFGYGPNLPDLSGRTCSWQTNSKYHVTAPFKVQEEKLTMLYMKNLYIMQENEFSGTILIYPSTM